MPSAVLAGVVLASVLLTGCAQSVDPIERLSRKAAQKVGPHPHQPTAATYRRWGVPTPLAAPPRPPGARPVPGAAARGLPPVVDHVPTNRRIVFLTFDDGAEKDPKFVDMVRELRLPVSLFLTADVEGPGYGRFGQLRAVGSTVQNRTLHHPFLPGLPYAGQRAEICGQQDKLKDRFGTRPRLLLPPYGKYDDDTLRAAADCGITAVVLWRASLQTHHLRYADASGGRLRPGDIVLVRFRGPDDPHGETLTAMTARLLRQIQEQGFTVARLEDYL
ncbi:polysaccharide deacetylase family protein [Streptomyces sp. NPDC002004]